jgi:hypothetical protein
MRRFRRLAAMQKKGIKKNYTYQQRMGTSYGKQ